MFTYLIDWKKSGSFPSVEWRLQIGAYARCPSTFDKTTGQIATMPEVDGAMVAWIGPHGVQPKLVLTKKELILAGADFLSALRFYRFLARHNPFIKEEQGRYLNPLKTNEHLVSVTQVLRHVIAKDGLMNWYYECGLEAGLTAVQLAAAVPGNEWDAVRTAKAKLNEKVLKIGDDEAKPWRWFKEQADKTGLTPIGRRDKAGSIGTTAHRNVAFFLKGKPVDLTQAPQPLVDTMAKFAMWATKHKVEPILVEQMVFDPELKYAGTLDAVLQGKETMVT